MTKPFTIKVGYKRLNRLRILINLGMSFNLYYNLI